MTCKELVEFLASYLAQELPREQRFDFDAHLAICASCVAYLDTYQETVRLGKSACADPDDDVPDDVPEDLVRAILSAREAG